MKKETRVYVLDLSDTEDSNMELNPQSEYFNEKRFMELSENAGSVYSLGCFQKLLNEQGWNVSTLCAYFKEVEYND